MFAIRMKRSSVLRAPELQAGGVPGGELDVDDAAPTQIQHRHSVRRLEVVELRQEEGIKRRSSRCAYGIRPSFWLDAVS
jgi:hypothetical protein